MNFIADKQTLDDLNLLGRYKPNSIYGIFNKVKTDGGARLLDQLFQHPLVDPDAINTRSRIFLYFQGLNLQFPLDPAVFNQMENYLSMGTASSYPAVLAGTLRKKIGDSFFRDEQFRLLNEGLTATISMLHALQNFITGLPAPKDDIYASDRSLINGILSDRRLDWLKNERNKQALSVTSIARYDHVLRHLLTDKMEQLMEAIYRLDVYMAVSDVARTSNFSYAKALPASWRRFETTALWHPALLKGIPNELVLNEDNNMVFLTGANMAGKSTFMKAFGIAVYLAHMGFPVAAKDMSFSVLDGLYSSINVPDDLNMGYSHFYAEVLRVKKVALEVSEGKNLVVLFDELFKGTNVKDAYDATLSVTESFAAYRNCFFIISTHIIEVGEALQARCENIQFSYLPTVMNGNTPRYTYRMTEGITSDRQGMMIIENEKILDML